MSINDTIASEALAAAVGGAISSGALYPMEVLKTRMQAEGDGSTNDTNNSHCDLPRDGKSHQKEGGEDVDIGDNKPKPATHSLDYARNIYSSEGIGVFFDGMEVSALQSAIEKALYFFAYTALKRSYTHLTVRRRTRQNGSPKQQQPSAMASVLLGCLAEWVHLPITLPIDALTTAIQTSGGSNKHAMHKSAARDRQKSETVLALWMTLWKQKSFYKGIQAYWILCFKPALQYTIFEQVKAWICKLRSIPRGGTPPQHFVAGQEPTKLSASEAFLLGMFSRTVATLVVFPFVRAKVRMQSLAKRESLRSEGCSSLGSSSTEKPSPVVAAPPQTIWQLLAETLRQGGWKALYQGLGPELTRGILSAALMMMVKERISGGVKKILYGGVSRSSSA